MTIHSPAYPLAMYLWPDEIKHAMDVGQQRQDHAVRNGIRDNWSVQVLGLDGLQIHQDACLTEKTVSIAFDEEWEGFRKDFKSIKADVGKRGRLFQVRSTRLERGNLLVQKKEKEETPERLNQIYILTRLHRFPDEHVVELVGWLYGRECMLPKYWQNGSRHPKFAKAPCYFVPAKKLRPLKWKSPTDRPPSEWQG